MVLDVAIIFVQNSSGELYIHKRSKTKKVFPGLYGIGAGGKIDPGEQPIEAARRELKEELDIDSNVEFLFDFDFSHSEMSYKAHIFKTTYDREIKSPCKIEFSETKWVPISDVDILDAENRLCPDTSIAYNRFKDISS